MENRFNILYWSLNYRYGSCSNAKTILDASIIVISKINKLIDDYNKEGMNVDAIVFTEGYPQENVESKKCDILSNYFENKGFVLHPYSNNDKQVINKPFYNGKQYVNAILIATLDKSFEIVKDVTSIAEPELLMLKNNKNIYLTGIRLSNSNQLKYVKDITNNIQNKIIVIGDYNMQPDKIDEISITDDWKFCEGMYKCEAGTNLDNSYIDHIYTKNCKVVQFKRIEKMDEFYKLINRSDVLKKQVDRWGAVISPYPDHNLLFASIDLGDDK